MDIEFVFSTTLPAAAKEFLIGLIRKGVTVEIFDSWSEVLTSRGVRWIRECDSSDYYSQVAATIKSGTVALVRKDLIRDYDMADKEDMAEVMEYKNSQYEIENPDEFDSAM